MKKQLLFLASFFVTGVLFATHNYAGEITYRQTGATEVEAYVITYTYGSSIPADRDSLMICWGDGTCDRISRENGPGNNGEMISEDIKMNIYPAVHTYAGMGTYTIRMDDPNRNGGILNVNFPNSENVVFSLAAQVTLLNPAFNDPVHSPVFLQAPIDGAFTFEPFMHSPNAFSMTGDSISYELITPIDMLNYVPVTEISPGPNNNLSLDEETGLLIWDAPQEEGLYVLTYQVRFYRDGQQIGWIVRDMMIEVEEGPGFAPEIVMQNITGNSETIEVDLGDTVRLEMSFSDMDMAQQLEISSSSGLYDADFNNQAMFVAAASGNSGTATFEWIVAEEHLREQPYQLVVRVADNDPTHAKSSLALVRFKTSASSTGIWNSPLDSGLKVFPNPVHEGRLHLSFEQATVFPKKYLVYNALGQIVKRGILSSETTTVGIETLPNGLYFLSVADKKIPSITSFVIDAK